MFQVAEYLIKKGANIEAESELVRVHFTIHHFRKKPLSFSAFVWILLIHLLS